MTAAPGKVRPRPDKGHDLEVLEKNTDTSWAMFQTIQHQHDRSFGQTMPAGLEHMPPPPAALTLEGVLQEARRHNRVCPTPVAWLQLFASLPNKPPELSPVPATRAEWDMLGPLQKRSRLREHIEWADIQGVLQEVYEALQALPENRWSHLGD